MITETLPGGTFTLMPTLRENVAGAGLDLPAAAIAELDAIAG